MKMKFTLVVAPPFVYLLTSLLVTPTHLFRKMASLVKPAWRRQVANTATYNAVNVIFW